MPAPRRDWAAVVDRLIEGDALALLELSRLVNGFLSRLGAYDFRDEWEDVIQEVVLATARALSEGRIERREAVVGYLQSTTRFVFFHRLKRHLRCSEDETLPWEEVSEGLDLPTGEAASPEIQRDVQQALLRLPDKHREAVVAVHVEGRTYDEASERTGIPLGSLKRYLRDGLAQLRTELALLVEDA